MRVAINNDQGHTLKVLEFQTYLDDAREALPDASKQRIIAAAIEGLTLDLQTHLQDALNGGAA